MKNMDNSVFDVIQAAMEGNFEGCGVYVGDLVNGGVGLAVPRSRERRPGRLKAEVEELKAKIITGEITDTGCISYPDSARAGCTRPYD